MNISFLLRHSLTCNLGWPRAYYVDWVGLEFIEIFLPLPLRMLRLKLCFTRHIKNDYS